MFQHSFSSLKRGHVGRGEEDKGGRQGDCWAGAPIPSTILTSRVRPQFNPTPQLQRLAPLPQFNDNSMPVNAPHALRVTIDIGYIPQEGDVVGVVSFKDGTVKLVRVDEPEDTRSTPLPNQDPEEQTRMKEGIKEEPNSQAGVKDELSMEGAPSGTSVLDAIDVDSYDAGEISAGIDVAEGGANANEDEEIVEGDAGSAGGDEDSDDDEDIPLAQTVPISAIVPPQDNVAIERRRAGPSTAAERADMSMYIFTRKTQCNMTKPKSWAKFCDMNETSDRSGRGCANVYKNHRDEIDGMVARWRQLFKGDEMRT
ncbi:hypothetical protein PENSPDRAFT_652844 [Peniophora sp. CONT]|nr:hypothetical protein PENSPDRAFT_652844 [Peniophora sp. CONT]